MSRLRREIAALDAAERSMRAAAVGPQQLTAGESRRLQAALAGAKRTPSGEYEPGPSAP